MRSNGRVISDNVALLRKAEGNLAKSVRHAHDEGASLRTLATNAGLNFHTVKAMVERTGKWQMN